jgi:hypothetical protein
MPVQNPFGSSGFSTFVKPEEDKKEEEKKPEVLNKEEHGTSEEQVMVDGKTYNKSKAPVNPNPSGQTKADILKEYNNIESDIPVTHGYWRMKG